MASEFDQSDFVDSEFQAAQKARAARLPTVVVGGAMANRPPTREELDVKVTETQQKLVDLKRAQEALERARAALEEDRRRRAEFHTGREEILKHLVRGIGLLTEAEFAARRDAEQMAKTLAGLQDLLGKVQAINAETWTTENYSVELTRGLTTIENARMEWNSALLKWPRLSGDAAAAAVHASAKTEAGLLDGRSFMELCKLGLALTWPLAIIALLAVAVVTALLFRH